MVNSSNKNNWGFYFEEFNEKKSERILSHRTDTSHVMSRAVSFLAQMQYKLALSEG